MPGRLAGAVDQLARASAGADRSAAARLSPLLRGGPKNTGSSQGRRDEEEEKGMPFGKLAPYLETAEGVGLLGSALGAMAWAVSAATAMHLRP